MTKNNKGRNGGDRPTPRTSNSQNHTGTDLLTAWFSLPKSSRIKRQQKRNWKYSNQRGRIDADLAGQLALLIVIVMLAVSGVSL